MDRIYYCNAAVCRRHQRYVRGKEMWCGFAWLPFDVFAEIDKTDFTELYNWLLSFSPFPTSELFRVLPRREELLYGL